MDSKTTEKKKQNVGLYGFTGCNGDQLVIVHSEDQLLDFFGSANIKSFSLAKSDNDETELDIAVIEGSISNEEQAEHVKHIRKRSKLLVAIGNCACFGGIQAMDVKPSWETRFKRVYAENKLELRKPTPSKPVGEIVKVDFCVPGCPIDADQFFFVFGQLLLGNQPVLPDYPVCAECRWRENECLLLKGIFCVGPLTAAGCGAVCPYHNLPCLGCWGPVAEGNVDSHVQLLKEKGFTVEAIRRRLGMHTGTGISESLKKLLGA
ncbi:MAG TPA: NADH:ubiquinone oxidoreductase [bacterium]